MSRTQEILNALDCASTNEAIFKYGVKWKDGIYTYNDINYENLPEVLEAVYKDNYDPQAKTPDESFTAEEKVMSQPIESYSGARFASGILVFLGWIGVLVGFVFLMVSLFGGSTYRSSGLNTIARTYGAFGSIGILVASFIQIGIGELIKAMVNSASDTREILNHIKTNNKS